MRIGIDVGGTNTDAVLLSTDNRLLTEVKTPTTPEVTDGVAWAVTDLLAAAAAMLALMAGRSLPYYPVFGRRPSGDS